MSDVSTMLQQLYDILEAEADKIINRINNGGDYSSEMFENPIEFLVDERPPKLIGYYGVYAFVISEDVHLSYEQVLKWCGISGAPYNDYRIRDLSEGMSLYVGSCSSESIYSRMGNHFKSDGSATSLNINHPNRVFLKDFVRIMAFPLKREYDKYAKLIVTFIEKRMHDVLKPITGKSKT